MRRSLIALAAILLFTPDWREVRADFITDPVGDFLSGYAGPKNGDVDVLSAGVSFDGSRYLLTATMNGAIGTTSGALYVWGVDRGAGTARFGSLAPGVTFDSVIVLQALRDSSGTLTGAGTVNRLVEGGSSTLAIGDVMISGNTISAAVLGSFLPSRGAAPAGYTFNLWPRVGAGNNNQISDFAPDNSNFGVSSVPEPSSLVLCGIATLSGLGVRACRAGRRRV